MYKAWAGQWSGYWGVVHPSTCDFVVPTKDLSRGSLRSGENFWTLSLMPKLHFNFVLTAFVRPELIDPCFPDQDIATRNILCWECQFGLHWQCTDTPWGSTGTLSVEANLLFLCFFHHNVSCCSQVYHIVLYPPPPPLPPRPTSPISLFHLYVYCVCVPAHECVCVCQCVCVWPYVSQMDSSHGHDKTSVPNFMNRVPTVKS